MIQLQGKCSQPVLTNRRVREECSASSTLFNIYIDESVRRWKDNTPEGIGLGRGVSLNCLFFADDLVILQENDNLQSVYHK